MNGWNRLFVVVAVVWALVAPFLVWAVANQPVKQVQRMCTDAAYNTYGTSSSPHLDMERYSAEVDKCMSAYVRDQRYGRLGRLATGHGRVGLHHHSLGFDPNAPAATMVIE
jgi:hypothetical protein